jgi:hypothetical protein
MGAPWTPGPWVVTTCMDYWIEPANAPKDGQFHGVALCGDVSWPDSDEKQPQWEANARLIAAAPDLAEAAEPFAAIDFFPDAPSSAEAIKVRVSIEGTAYEEFVTIGDFRRIRAALSKAKGETE